MTQDILSHSKYLFSTFVMLLLLIFPLISNAGTITQFSVRNIDAQTQITFDLSHPVTPQIFSLNNPIRLVIDLPNTKQSIALNAAADKNSPLIKIRQAGRPNKALRVVFDLANQVKYHSKATSENNHHQIILTLSPLVEKPITNAPDPIKTPTKPTPPAATQPPTPKEETTPPAADNTPPPQAISTHKPTEQRDIIVAIDAGHGGRDHGAKGRNGTKEKVITLEIARRLAKLIDAEQGMRAYLTRDNDTFISLRSRIKRARKQKADMFISIHADAFQDQRARGSSVFVLSERGASSEAAKLIADKENAADLVGGVSLDDKDDLLASVLVDLSQNASLEASYEVASTILSGLKRIGRVHKKKVESAGFVVLKSPDIPSVLVETAFITNPDEERKLRSASHQNKLARAILTGIRSYFRSNPLPFSAPIPQQYVVKSGDSLSRIAQRYKVSMAALKKANNLRSSKILIGQKLQIP